jgi:hypothetical protein
MCWMSVHCGIYKSSYYISNIIYLNSPPPPFSFILLSPHSWNSFNRYHFSIYIHVYTVFAVYSPSFTISPPLLPFHLDNPLLPPYFPPQAPSVLPSFFFFFSALGFELRALCLLGRCSAAPLVLHPPF